MLLSMAGLIAEEVFGSTLSGFETSTIALGDSTLNDPPVTIRNRQNNHYEELKIGPFMDMSMLKILLLILFCGCSCETQRKANSRSESEIVPAALNTGATTPTSRSPEVSEPEDARKRAEQVIDAIDFKNFTFPWYPKGYRPPSGKRNVSLRNGELVVDQSGNTNDVLFSLINVSIAELTGDNVKEAIVTVTANFNPGGSYACTFIYTLKSGRPFLLWKLETGDRAYGGLRRISLTDGSLIVEKYASEFDKHETPMCCPKKFQRLYYKWNGKQLQKIRTQELPNEFENARFLGYPEESRR